MRADGRGRANTPPGGAAQCAQLFVCVLRVRDVRCWRRRGERVRSRR